MLAACLLMVTMAGTGGLVNAAEPPRLVLQITVDALRADLLQRYRQVLGEGGFRYLMDKGAYFTNAHYRHANTETIVGHVSLATGAVPAAHGMVGNVWFDQLENRLVYNIEDPEYHLLTPGADVSRSTEIDPTQKTARVDGRSPRNILVSTFSDELAQFTQGKAKIFSVSVKDRGAVSLAGQTGKAFWFSKASGQFVTSDYYYTRYPAWVNEWNATGKAARFAGKVWRLLYPRERYRFGDRDEQDFETDFPGFGRTFPHAYGGRDDKYFTTRLTLGPAGDELTLDFAMTLLEQESLGQDEITDYLAISFSSTDYVGHMFGASSLESEDNLAHLDRVLARLFAHVDEKVGLDNTLIVLSADHGQPETPGYLHELGMSRGHYFNFKGLDKTAAIAALKKRFGFAEELIQVYYHPYVYLNRKAIRKHGLDLRQVEEAVAEELMKLPGIAYAVSSQALNKGEVPRFSRMASVLNNYNPRRSGDVYVVFEPDVFINDFDGLVVASTHGSPWRYDSFVPVIFAGWQVPGERISRPVTPYDIAPTLSAAVGAKVPSAALGNPLPEVTGGK
ncbi:alkaline phosphatase family protein [Thiolapillus sp.]